MSEKAIPVENKKKEIQIKVKNDDVAAGTYANSFTITFNADEFLLDFIMMQPQAPLGLLTSRIILSPGKARELARVLNDVVKKRDEMHRPPSVPTATS